MKTWQKLSMGISACTFVEFLTYIIFQPKDLELFHMVWIAIYAYLLLQAIFIRDESGFRNIEMASCSAYHMASSGESRKRVYPSSKGESHKVLQPMNIVFLLSVIGNIILLSRYLKIKYM